MEKIVPDFSVEHRMKIAFVVSNLTYPPREGLHQQTILTAQMQVKRGDDLHLLGFCRNLQELDLALMEAETGLTFAMAPIRSRLPDVLLGLKLRLLPRRFRGKKVRELEALLTTDYDIIHLENVGACGLVTRRSARKTLLGLIDPGTLRWKRMAASGSSLRNRVAAAFKFKLHAILERLILFGGSYVHVASPIDAAYLRKRYPSICANAIPVVMPDEYLNCERITRAARSPSRAVVSLDLRQPHLRSAFFWFVQSVFRPLIAVGLPLHLMVLGRVNPDPELAASCSELDVVFQRWVPNFQTALCDSDILIAPDLTGTGLKNRVLQGMALGLPVVGTDVAFEGIGAIDGIHAYIANDADKMKADLTALCGNAELAHRIGMKAHEFVKTRFSSEAVMQQWADLYAELSRHSK